MRRGCAKCPAVAAVLAVDEPENEGALLFGDAPAAVALCVPCFAETEVEGPWDVIAVLDSRGRILAAA